MVEDINAYNDLKNKVTTLFSEVVVADRRVAGQEGVVIGERMIHQFPWSERTQMLYTASGATLDTETKLYVPRTPDFINEEMLISLVVHGMVAGGRKFNLAGRLDTYVLSGYRDCVLEQASRTGLGGVQRLGVAIDGMGNVYADSPFFKSAPRVNNMPSYMAMLRESQAILGFLHAHLLHQTKYLEDSSRTN